MPNSVARDLLKKLLTPDMGIDSHHGLDRSKLIVAEASRGESREAGQGYVIVLAHNVVSLKYEHI